jgi:cytochrome b pre-mRNA-processing protein 3
MSLLKRLFNRTPDPKEAMAPLYAAIVARGREPHWYLDGKVPDTLDGRFDMIAAVLSTVLLHLEQAERPQENVWLTELFVDDMDGQLRQLGVGDVVVGKHIGRMMSALGGRLAAYRDGMAAGGDMADALRRNLYRGEEVPPGAVAHVATGLRALARSLAAHPTERLLAGELPR